MRRKEIGRKKITQEKRKVPQDTQGIGRIRPIGSQDTNESIKTPAEWTRFCLSIKYNQQRRIHEDTFTPISSRKGKFEFFATGT